MKALKNSVSKRESKGKKVVPLQRVVHTEEVVKQPITFTVHMPDGSTEVRDFNATMPLMELVESICNAKGIPLSALNPTVQS